MANVSRILAELILDESDFEEGLKDSEQASRKTTKKIEGQFTRMIRNVSTNMTALSTGITNGLKSIGPGLKAASSQIDALGGRAVENAERFTFLGAAFLAPLALSFKRFADANAEARQKIAELREEQKSLKPFEFAKNQDIELQIANLQKVVEKTQEAADTQDKLGSASSKVLDAFGRLTSEALAPYIGMLADGLLYLNGWIKRNPELVKQGILITASIGAFFAVVGPGLLVVGKLVRVFSGLVYGLGLLANPIGIAVVAVGLLTYTFREQLFPVFQETVTRLTSLWEAFQGGELTTGEALRALVENITLFITSALDAVLREANKRWVPDWINSIFMEEFDKAFADVDNINSTAESIFAFFRGAFIGAARSLNKFLVDFIPELMNPVNEAVTGYFTGVLNWWGGQNGRDLSGLDPAGLLNPAGFGGQALTSPAMSSVGRIAAQHASKASANIEQRFNVNNVGKGKSMPPISMNVNFHGGVFTPDQVTKDMKSLFHRELRLVFKRM